jgi:hypothetical protein
LYDGLQRWLKIVDREDRLASPASGHRGGGLLVAAFPLGAVRLRSQVSFSSRRATVPAQQAR